MSHPIPVLRLTPQAAGTLQQQYTKAVTALNAMTRHNKEFDPVESADRLRRTPRIA